MEGDAAFYRDTRPQPHFYPRPPGGGRPRPRKGDIRRKSISIHALRVEGDFETVCKLASALSISIHALRVEGDVDRRAVDSIPQGISIHALRVEGDTVVCGLKTCKRKFLSTPSRWRATQKLLPLIGVSVFLSTPSRWRATVAPVSVCGSCFISIHALQVEGDGGGGGANIRNKIFLSTPSRWRATGGRCLRLPGRGDFYPRPPGGGRLDVAIDNRHRARISIHALQVEGDLRDPFDFVARYLLCLSTPSRWRATSKPAGQPSKSPISIHALQVEGDGIQLARIT